MKTRNVKNKNTPALGVIDFFLFFKSLLFISSLIFIISFLLMTLGFVCSNFSRSLSLVVYLEFFLFFWGKPVSLWTSLLGLLLLHPIGFVWLCFIVICLEVFLISSLISLLTHWFFSSILFSLHVIVFFLVSLSVVDF